MKKVITLDIQPTMELEKYLSDNDIHSINKTPLIKRVAHLDAKHYRTIKALARSCKLVGVAWL